VSFLLSGCNSIQALSNKTPQANIQIVKGKVYYLERKLLPPGATLEITLEDVSKMDIESTKIASITQKISSAPPYTFNLEYDASLIKPNMRYNLRAKITLAEKLLMASTEHLNPFKDSTNINIKLSIVGRSVPSSPVAKSAGKSVDNSSPIHVDSGLAVVSVNPLSTLSNTYWKLMTLNNEVVTMTKQQKREAFIQLNDELKSVKGFGSCNQFQGRFKLNGNTLNFRAISSTQMACLNSSNVETKFLNVLALTGYYSIHEHDLTLLNNAKKPIATFQAQYFN
jgi:putative lipoprotein